MSFQRVFFVRGKRPLNQCKENEVSRANLLLYYPTAYIYSSVNIILILYLYYEVTGEWRKLHNEELSGLYSLPNIVRVVKSRRMRWAGHVARMAEG
jgi:hypothetical protein